MVFGGIIFEEMVNKPIVYVILLHLILITDLHGSLTCPRDLVPCSNATHCIRIEQVCTEYHGCLDQQGQPICNYCSAKAKRSIACLTSLEPNLSFDCLSPNQICDGHEDCVNKFDESLCGTKTCGEDSWLCKNGSCIEKKHLCDGKAQCADGSDEGEFCPSHSCGLDHMRCPTGECILQSKKCDGVAHCSDAFDEKDCPRQISKTIEESCSIPTNTFSCSADFHKICISNDRVCDGFVDCPMGDDEQDCTESCQSKSRCPNDPNIRCIQRSPAEQICRCQQAGYKFTSATSRCQDVNECRDSRANICSYSCTNTEGSFNCACPLGYTVDQKSKTCRNNNEPTKLNLLILSDHSFKFLHLQASNSTRYSLNTLRTMNSISYEQIAHLLYDPYQNFMIYSDQTRQNLYCKSSLTSETRLLISDTTIQAFTYDPIERSLFLIDSDSQTLRLYTPISCDASAGIQMHRWQIDDQLDQIRSMDVDAENRQLIFASRYNFFISNFSQPNQTELVYSTDREIQRFVYQPSFQRLFWTSISQTNESSFPVYTCDQQFRNCQDTLIVLPFAWPFAFFDDGLIYESLSQKSLEYVQIFGQNRFSKRFISSISDNIRSLSIIHYPQTATSKLCTEAAAKISCQNEICLRVNSTGVTCLSVDQKLPANHLSIKSDLVDSPHASNDTDIHSEIAKKGSGYQPTNTILFCILAIGIVAIIVAFIAKRCYRNVSRKNLDIEQRRNERCLTNDEPTLDEFNIVVDERVSPTPVQYAREIFIETPNRLLLGRRRDSV